MVYHHLAKDYVAQEKYYKNNVYKMNPFKKESYDKKYDESLIYKNHYLDLVYYPIWEYIMDNLNIDDKILDLGCGPSHLGHMLSDNDFKEYVGIDFSSVAIKMAKEKTYYTYIESDLNHIDYTKYNDYVIVSTETFEHIEDDIGLIKKLPKNKIIFSVPNFMSKNHYRTYDSEEQIRNYYKNIIDVDNIKEFKFNKSYIFVAIGKII